MKKIIYSLILLMLLSACSNQNNYILKNVINPKVSQIGGEWSVIALQMTGNTEFNDIYVENLKEILKENDGVIDENKTTEYARVTLALNVLGYNPCDFQGFNLTNVLVDVEKVRNQGINGVIYALIALESVKAEYSENVRDEYIKFILESQMENGSFSLGGKKPMIDVTAMALQALSFFKTDENISDTIDKALEYISENQEKDGTFSYDGNYSSATIAQVIIALNMLDIDVLDDRFSKEKNLLESLEMFEIGSGYKNGINDNEVNLMASEQVLCALASQEKKEKNLGNLYDEMVFDIS